MENRIVQLIGGGGFLALTIFIGYSLITTPNPVSPSTNSASSPQTNSGQENNINQINNQTNGMNKKHIAVLETAAGTIEIELHMKDTPVTASNFIKLAKDGFYNNTIFHRTIKGFMIQGGDPNGDGTGGPGYKFNDEPFTGEYLRGTVAMANSGPNTNGSQFFIMHADYPLPKNYVIFGHVIKGIETVDKIAEAPVKPNPYTREMSVPANPITVRSVIIREE